MMSHWSGFDLCNTTVISSIFLLLLSVLYFYIKNRNLLPGPYGIPYLGLYPYLTDENVHMKLDEYKKKYGDMFSFTYTGRLYINLGSAKAMRDVQVQKSDCFIDRYKDANLLTEIINDGVLFENGERWKVLRKFFIQKFRDYGLNAVRDDLAGPLYDSLNATIEDLKILCENPINIMDFLAQHCAITMRKILFGAKGATDEDIGRMVEHFAGSLEGNGAVNLLLIGPLARLLFWIKPSFRKNLKHACEMKKIIRDCSKRIETYMSEDHPQCITEEFLKERNERRRNKDPSWQIFSDEALVDSLLQFVGDGIASLAAFIAGILNLLLEYPEEQEKIYCELIEVIGTNREPIAEDRSNLPYTNAFLNEYVRTSKFLIFFASVECTKETFVRGYRIPKGSITLLNFWSANHDPEAFDDPEKFNPSRFLSSSKESKTESPVLFGMGKRICTGEPFVMLQTFLFLTTIVKNFKIVSSNAPSDKSIDFLVSGKLELSFIPRNDN